jgi:SNF2 family DNA or RNA helicase
MSLDKHQLARLHGVLGPFMLRRVKKDVVAEMVPKTEVRHIKITRRSLTDHL